MAKAKITVKPVAVKPEPKQIVLTKEQYDTLITIYDTLNEVKDSIEDLVNNDENTQILLGYQLGGIFSSVNSAFEKLDELTDVIYPADDDFYSEDEDEDIDGGF
jgi:hypothetical protein